MAKNLHGFGLSLYRGIGGNRIWSLLCQIAYNLTKLLQLYNDEKSQRKKLDETWLSGLKGRKYRNHAEGSHCAFGKSRMGNTIARKAGAVHVFDTINHMFLMNQMIVTGSIYWNLGLGLEKGEVNGDQEALTNMENLGQIIDWLAASIALHKAKFPEINRLVQSRLFCLFSVLVKPFLTGF